MNFTKPNSATIRYTNSQWLREDATEAPVEGVALPKTVQKPPLPRDNLNTMGTARVTCALEHTQDTLTGGNGITIARVSCTGAHSR